MSEKQDYSSIATPVYEVPPMPPPVVVHQPVIVQQPYVPPNLPLIIPNVYSPPPVPAGNGVIVQQISDGDQNVIRINIQPQQQGQQMQFQPQHVQQVYSNPQVNNNYKKKKKKKKEIVHKVVQIVAWCLAEYLCAWLLLGLALDFGLHANHRY